jgi:hypothetical protein
LDRILQTARSGGAGALGVFDLDGCLFDTRPRQVKILHEAAAVFDLPGLGGVREEHFVDWSLGETLARAGVEPGWIERNLAALRKWWAERFFASSYVTYDRAMPGAPELVRAVHAADVHVVYLTGRDASMRTGTETALARAGFPFGVAGATLVVKPDAAQDDTAFKDHALDEIQAWGEIVLYLDNEPANVNLYRRRHPDALVVFVETDHSPRPDEPDPGIPWLRGFWRG